MSIFDWRKGKLNKSDLKTLIYYITLGEQCAKLTSISIQTLLINGNYKGDILVFGDDYFIKNNKFDIEIIRVEQGDFHVFDCKFIFGEQIDHTKYDQIMYLDSDIEVLNNVYPLFTAEGKLLHRVERWHKQKDEPYGSLLMSNLFTKEEYEQYKDNYISNAGQFCIDAKLFKQFIGEWKKLVSRNSLMLGNDQSGFNLLIYKNLIPNESWEDKFINFTRDKQLILPKEVILDHYFWKFKIELLKKYNLL